MPTILQLHIHNNAFWAISETHLKCAEKLIDENIKTEMFMKICNCNYIYNEIQHFHLIVSVINLDFK